MHAVPFALHSEAIMILRWCAFNTLMFYPLRCYKLGNSSKELMLFFMIMTNVVKHGTLNIQVAPSNHQERPGQENSRNY